MTEQDAYIALNMMERVGPVSVRAMVDALGSVTAIWEADKNDLMKCRGIGNDTSKVILAQRNSIDVDGERARAASHGAHIVTPLDHEYPETLREIHDPPLALYVRGSILSRDRRAVAVVGTRRATHYGMQSTRKIAGQLARAGITIESGLALGVDTAAHEAALKAGGRTIAVIGSGLDCFYPPENAKLADEITEQGAVITEFPFGREPDKTTFPMRNRIVSGMSEGVLVVEAGRRSGATITANQALQQGRSVFAIPGRIDSYASIGTHELIKNGAYLVTDGEDILEHFEMLFPRVDTGTAGKPAMPPADLNEDEKRIVALLGDEERQVDEVARELGLAPRAINALLLSLELKKVIRMLPGRQIERLR